MDKTGQDVLAVTRPKPTTFGTSGLKNASCGNSSKILWAERASRITASLDEALDGAVGRGTELSARLSEAIGGALCDKATCSQKMGGDVIGQSLVTLPERLVVSESAGAVESLQGAVADQVDAIGRELRQEFRQDFRLMQTEAMLSVQEVVDALRKEVVQALRGERQKREDDSNEIRLGITESFQVFAAEVRKDLSVAEVRLGEQIVSDLSELRDITKHCRELVDLVPCGTRNDIDDTRERITDETNRFQDGVAWSDEESKAFAVGCVSRQVEAAETSMEHCNNVDAELQQEREARSGVARGTLQNPTELCNSFVAELQLESQARSELQTLTLRPLFERCDNLSNEIQQEREASRLALAGFENGISKSLIQPCDHLATKMEQEREERSAAVLALEVGVVQSVMQRCDNIVTELAKEREERSAAVTAIEAGAIQSLLTRCENISLELNHEREARNAIVVFCDHLAAEVKQEREARIVSVPSEAQRWGSHEEKADNLQRSCEAMMGEWRGVEARLSERIDKVQQEQARYREEQIRTQFVTEALIFKQLEANQVAILAATTNLQELLSEFRADKESRRVSIETLRSELLQHLLHAGSKVASDVANMQEAATRKLIGCDTVQAMVAKEVDDLRECLTRDMRACERRVDLMNQAMQ